MARDKEYAGEENLCLFVFPPGPSSSLSQILRCAAVSFSSTTRRQPSSFGTRLVQWRHVMRMVVMNFRIKMFDDCECPSSVLSVVTQVIIVI